MRYSNHTVATETSNSTVLGVAGRYVEFCAGHLAQLEDLIARHDLKAVSQIAENLSGNAGRLGLSELSSLSRQLEEYCFGADWAAIDSAYRAIAETVSKLCATSSVEVGVDGAPEPPPQDLDL